VQKNTTLNVHAWGQDSWLGYALHIMQIPLCKSKIIYFVTGLKLPQL